MKTVKMLICLYGTHKERDLWHCLKSSQDVAKKQKNKHFDKTEEQKKNSFERTIDSTVREARSLVLFTDTVDSKCR